MTRIIVKHILILSVLFTMFLTSCEDKHGKNGELDGNWQLLSWIDNHNVEQIQSDDARIYYAVSLNIIKMSQPTKNTTYYLSTFTKKGDSITLDKVYVSPFDSLVTTKDLSPYGVSSDGNFKILKLDDNILILRNTDYTLSFRRY